jgi:glycosyltransferase involved in cell wall biosynthesis
MNVLFVSGIAGDTRRYRCHHHQEQLALHGVASVLREASDPQVYVEATIHDLFILHRVSYSEQIGDLLEIARLRGAPVIFETDDLVFEPALYDQIAFVDTLSPEAAQQFRQDLYAQALTFARCDYVLTTTQYLAGAAARHGKQVFIQRNACSAGMLQEAETAYALRKVGARPEAGPLWARRLAPTSPSSAEEANQDPGAVVLGYFSGTGSHNRDFASITPALLTILARYPQVWLHVSGHLALDSRFQAYRDRIRRAPFVAWQELPNLVAQVDINLAPLEVENPFCQAKSEIKYTEAALVGVPTIASPTEAFRYAIQPGETGLLAGSMDAWVESLARLIDDPAERCRLGENARRQVYAAYAPQPRSLELLATLRRIQAQHAGATVDLAQAAVLVARGMKRHLDSLLAANEQQARQLDQLRQTIAAWQPPPDEGGSAFWRRRYDRADQQHIEALRGILGRLQQSRQSDPL